MKIPRPWRRYIETPTITIRSRTVPGPRCTRTDPAVKRELFIYETDRTKATIQKIIDDPDTPDKIRIQAANCIANLVRVGYQMVKDIDVEDVERQIEELENEINEHRDEEVDFSPLEADSAPVEEDGEKKQPSKTPATGGVT
jgi:hypothetical protein